MKSILTVVMGMMLVLTTLAGQAMEMPEITRIGIHGSYTEGGDLEDSEFGFGGQAELAITENFGFELALTRLTDEPAPRVDLNITTVSLSAIGRHRLAQNLDGFVLGGVNYNFLSLSSPFDLKVENDFGLHVGGGLGYELAENWELFAEYRYTFLSADVKDQWHHQKTSHDLDFGLIKVGLNYLF